MSVVAIDEQNAGLLATLEPAASAVNLEKKMRVVKKERFEGGSNWRSLSQARKEGWNAKSGPLW
jgi:hypothetical protein